MGIILDWMRENSADIVCVQETKVTDADFPVDPIREAGYFCAFAGQKSYNGVAMIAREELTDVVIGTGNDIFDTEARIIRGSIKGVTVVNTYVPQGTAVSSPRFQYKLDWILGMKDYFSRSFAPEDSVVWVGDFNVARESIDVYDPEGLYGGVCYHPDEHLALNAVMKWGFVDVFRKHHPGEANQYSFFDYRIPSALKRKIGWRIDHIWATKPLAECSTDCWIDLKPRTLEKPSDHTFVAVDFSLPTA